MGSYLAVIKDSFREALASRVLWILFVLMTVVLCALAPLGKHELTASKLQHNHFLDLDEIVLTLHESGKSETPSPAQHIWRQMDWSAQEVITAYVIDSEDVTVRYELAHSLNELIESGSIYTEEVFADTPLGEEADELLKVEERTDGQNVRLNRLALQAVFPDTLYSPSKPSLVFSYLWYKADEHTAEIPEVFEMGFLAFLGILVRVCVGPPAMLLAILVTASIIPKMLEEGSIDLLLSKPISRTLLLLTKFVGGCFFVLLSAGYLLVGVWLLVGLRFGIWNFRLLLCIPVLLFLFTVFYSVSTLAALMWRNSIVAMGVTLLFWGVCTVIGVSKSGVETMRKHQEGPSVLVQAGDHYLRMFDYGGEAVWNSSSSSWESAFLMANPAYRNQFAPWALKGLVYDESTERLLAVSELDYVPDGMSHSKWSLWAASANEGWNWERLGDAPRDTVALLERDDNSIIAVGHREAFLLKEEAQENNRDSPWYWESLTAGNREDSHSAFSAAIDHATGDLVILTSRKQLEVHEKNDSGQYEQVRIQSYPGLNALGRIVVAQGTIYLAGDWGGVYLFDSQTLELLDTWDCNMTPGQITSSHDGEWVVVQWEDESLWVIDAKKKSRVAPALEEPRTAGAFTFDDASQLIAINYQSKVTFYELPDGKPTKDFGSKPSLIDRVYQFVILPTYTVLPQPGELSHTVVYLMARVDQKEGEEEGPPADPMAKERNDLLGDFHPWRPVWKSFLFLVVMLSISCWCFHRKEV